MNLKDIEIGQMLFWHDPDGDLCSNEATVIDINGEIVVLKTDAGGLIEAFAHELSENPKNKVDN